MTVEELNHLIEDTSLLTAETLPAIRQIVDDFPYFHTARLLYLKNLAVLSDPDFDAELRRMAIYVTDRKKLLRLIEGEKAGFMAQPENENADEKEDTFSLIDAFLSNQDEQQEPNKDSSLLFQPSVSSDYIFWSLSNEEARQPELPEKKLQHQDLIDSFIKNDQERSPGSGLDIRKERAESETPVSVRELDEDRPKSLDDSYFTETLARIYVKQKRYDKALQIIKNLSLKYPEKNVYFADQMRFLEKLIINIKK